MLSWWAPALGQSWCRAIPILLMSELIDSLGMPPHQPRTEVCSSSKEKMCFAFKIRLRVKNAYGHPWKCVIDAVGCSEAERIVKSDWPNFLWRSHIFTDRHFVQPLPQWWNTTLMSEHHLVWKLLSRHDDGQTADWSEGRAKVTIFLY